MVGGDNTNLAAAVGVQFFQSYLDAAGFSVVPADRLHSIEIDRRYSREVPYRRWNGTQDAKTKTDFVIYQPPKIWRGRSISKIMVEVKTMMSKSEAARHGIKQKGEGGSMADKVLAAEADFETNSLECNGFILFLYGEMWIRDGRGECRTYHAMTQRAAAFNERYSAYGWWMEVMHNSLLSHDGQIVNASPQCASSVAERGNIVCPAVEKRRLFS